MTLILLSETGFVKHKFFLAVYNKFLLHIPDCLIMAPSKPYNIYVLYRTANGI